MIRGLNHLTLAVADLDRALAFYRDVLGLTVAAHWASGAYLEAGALWLCLSQDDKRKPEPAACSSSMWVRSKADWTTTGNNDCRTWC